MTHEESPRIEPPPEPLDAELRKDLHKSLVMAFPMMLLGMGTHWLLSRFETQPDQALLIIIPGIIFLSLIYLRTTTRQRLKLGWPFAIFLTVYILIFFLAADSAVLDWKHSPVGYKEKVPPNFLALNRFGDWHYSIVDEVIADPDLAIVLMKPPQTVDEGRIQFQTLINLARISEARGVALDSYFESADENPGVNDLLCADIENAKAKDIPVLAAYDYRVAEGEGYRVKIDPDLKECLGDSDLGHAVGYQEGDGKVRYIPLYLKGDKKLESLSLKIARKLDPQLKDPAQSLLQFTKPEDDFRLIPFAELEEADRSSEEVQSKLRDKFILVGEDSEQDRFDTPYGIKPGVVIHAYAVHSLRQNGSIKRAEWWFTLPIIALSCYLMMVLTSLGVGNLKLILINVASSVLIVTIAILAIYLFRAWIDLVYPLLATWLFLLLLIGLRKIGMDKASASTG